MSAAEQRLQAVATNLANADVHGFKRIGTATQSFDRMLSGRMERQITTTTQVDFEQGVLRPTGNTWDLALNGPGFFVVESAGGEGYTRDGRFHIDDRGTLQTLGGMPIAWDGPRGYIDPRLEEPTVDEEGIVYQGERQVGTLKLTNFRAPGRLEMGRDSLWHAPNGMAETTHEAIVRQGELERSNVSTIDEMIALITVQRNFESSTRLMSMIDQSLRRLTATPR